MLPVWAWISIGWLLVGCWCVPKCDCGEGGCLYVDDCNGTRDNDEKVDVLLDISDDRGGIKE